ncbi:glycosyltransferase family 4 protein [Solwaraspora sp. WMMD1047]|uniref:glycosyltransferase family 4 protein n=1 Tax=Solwaraspora sp. WMMD1047 TaxID=3016102 RepID=UPI00241625A6|nr:glycosyltransferase family 4 protein [Solwaraspora sp. WMMD1047]MDG4829855.1 glycosyltransferase family 4 protein [Solwaraspora sp. WMMD1047]
MPSGSRPDPDGPAAIRVLHVSHTSEGGGAELALRRLLTTDRPGWHASICTAQPAATPHPDRPGGAAGNPSGVIGDPPGDIGGDDSQRTAGDRVSGVFAGLDRRGVPVDQVLPVLPGGGTRGLDPRLAARYLAALTRAARRLRRSPLFRAADLLHANTAAAAIICALATPDRRHPLVVHLRDLVDGESLGRFGLLALRRIALPRVDGVLANSAATLRSAESWLGAEVPRAVVQSPLGVTHRTTRSRVGPTVRAIGMLGRLQRWKGQHVFLDAFARSLADTGVPGYLAGAALFGEEGYAAELRAQATRLGIADRVTFLGHVDDVAGFLDRIDVLVHASTRPEPLGQTVLQGLAHGLPVVATEGGGPGEWLRSGENGLLVPANDPAALGAALRTVVDSRELREKLAAGAAGTAVQTDQDCVDRHAAFFDTVRRAHRSTGRAGTGLAGTGRVRSARRAR